MLKNILRAAAKRLGYEVLGPPRAYAATATLSGLLRTQAINLVLDVGANVGQFVHDLRSGGYAGRVISFEPQSAAHQQLVLNAARDHNWTIFERTAVGDTTGTVDINLAGNSFSSSILPMLASHREAAPQSAYQGTETVPVQRLDDMVKLNADDRILLKIDVQGFEMQVLQGASRLLKSCDAVLCELSLVPLYEGQVLAKELWDLLANEGFEAWSFEPGIRDGKTSRMLQLDGLFLRSETSVAGAPGR